MAFRARHPETMERLPYYHVLFPTEGPSEYFGGGDEATLGDTFRGP